MPRPSTVVVTWKPKLECWLNDRQAAYESQPEDLRSPTLPVTNDGMVNIAEVAKELKCPRAYLYDYEPLSSLIDLFAEGQKLLPSGARTLAAGDSAVKERMAMLAKTAKMDGQAAVEAKAALQGALTLNSELQAEVLRLRLENVSLKEQIALMHEGVSIRLR
ncbi:TPA: hypothetical protein QEL46_002498 [Stenotrophomonas maltophilia]|nr:hypothetical protein [Stenotrophomonas maltophilia]